MGRHTSPYYSPPRRGYSGRGRTSPPRRGYGGRREESNGSLLVRNIPLNCSAEDLRVPFERFGPVRDVYLPKDYYTGEPRGFAFVQFVDPFDGTEAQYQMNRRLFCGREITVVHAAETRKRPEEMRGRDRTRGPSGYDGRRSRYGRPRSRSVSRSRSPRYTRPRSRSYSPAPRPQHGRTRSWRDHPEGREDHRSYSPTHSDPHLKKVGNGYEKESHEDGGSRSRLRSLRRTSGSPPGSRSRSAELSPR